MVAGRLIRLATVQDIPRITDMTERLAASVSGPQRVDRLKTGQTLAGLMQSPDGAVFVSGGGFIAGQVLQTIISFDPVAFEFGWYAEDRSGLRLLRTLESWSREQGATMLKMSCNGGTAQRILERCGYQMAEIQMIKVL